MKGLLIKDWITIWKQYRFMLCLVLLYLIIGIVQTENTYWVAFAGIFTGMLPISVLGMDEKSGWERYAIMLPCSRKETVRSKYLLGITGIVGIAICYIVLRTGFLTLKGMTVPVEETVNTALGVVCLPLLFLSLNLPIMLKKGVEKGRMWFYVLLVGAMAASSFLLKLIESKSGTEAAASVFLPGILQSQWLTWVMMLTITAVIVTVSVKIAEFWYDRREL